MASATAPAAEVTFAFEDHERRTFVALNRAGDGYHLVHPVAADDIRVTGYIGGTGMDIPPKVAEGDLVCECRGGRFHGTCYAVKAATARLTVDFGDAGWDGAGASVEAARG